MKISEIKIHNYRSILDATIEAHDFLALVGENNAGKSNVLSALRTFYEDNMKWTPDDFPKIETADDESWVEITFTLSEDEWESLADKYKAEGTSQQLTLRRYFKGAKVKNSQSNIFAIVDGDEEADLFYGAKNIGTAKCGSVIYIPALTTPNEQMKTSGPSPLRNMLNFMLKKVVKNSDAYQIIAESFEILNTEANEDGGFLTQITNPINKALSTWGIEIDLSIASVSPEVITKSLIQCSFCDSNLDGCAMGLEKYGHGFQRSVIYELIKIAPSFKEVKESVAKEFSPDFTLLLFEEPEAFLHPSQQESMAFHLRRLGGDAEMQVIATSHSPVFVGKNSDDLCQICRINKVAGKSHLRQLTKQTHDDLLAAGGDLVTAMRAYAADGNNPEAKRAKASSFIANAPAEAIAKQQDRFRYQLWLDSERSSMFFAKKVLLVEGETEKALFNYLLSTQWHSLTSEQIFVVSALGKYNFHRFISLFKAFGIPHGVMFDDDHDKDHHDAINNYIVSLQNAHTLAQPIELTGCLETHVGLTIPGRNDQKPLEILRAIENSTLTQKNLDDLESLFCSALAITP